MHVLSDEVSPNEEVMLTSLKSNDPSWRRSMAQKMSRAAQPPLESKWWIRIWEALRPQLLPVSVALASAVIVGWIAFHFFLSHPHQGPAAPLALIASAYTEHRTLELRIPGASNAPIRVERGTSGSNLDKPEDLLRAEALIGEGLHKNPDDTTLLDAKARADLLDNNYEAAIKSLQRALETESNSAPLKIDLATAYFLRAEKTGRDGDYHSADEYLGEVLATTPDNSVALFNRAVVAERIYLYGAAEEDWKKFLQIETDPGWLSEGKHRYELLQQRIQKQEQNNSRASPIRDPASALSALRSHAINPNDKTWPLPLDEAYLDTALTEWLPTVASHRQLAEKKSSTEWAALNALSDILRTQHGDEWLSDLLKGPHSSAWADGALELSAAAQANAQGDMDAVIAHATRSMKQFQLARNDAGEVGARYEYFTGSNQSQLEDRCMSIGSSGLQGVHRHHYAWFETQILFVVSDCYFFKGNTEQAMLYAAHAVALADQARYAVLQLWGQYYLDGVQTPWVASPDSWARISAGLREFSQGWYPPVNGYVFCVDMGHAAESREMWQLAEAAAKEAVRMSSGIARTYEAFAHHWLARVAEAANDTKLAEIEYEKASELFSGLGTREARALLLESEIDRASLEVKQKKFEAAGARLERVKAGLSSGNYDYAYVVSHWASLGELHLRTGKLQLAETELLEAVRLIEKNEDSLSSEADILTWQRETAGVYRALLEIYSENYRDGAKSFGFLEWYRGEPLWLVVRSRRQPGVPSIAQGKSSSGLTSVFAPREYALKPGDAVITWASLPNGLAVWLLDSNGVHFSWVNVSAASLLATVTRFTRLCADPSSDPNAIDRDAHQLYDWLVRPVETNLKGSARLLVEPDESLTFIPFQALKAPDGRYLGDLLPMVESPGLAYSQILRPATAVSAHNAILAVGNPLLTDPDLTEFTPLPEANLEAHDVAAKFDHRHLLTGTDATLTKVKEMLPQVEIFHFAGHALSGNHGSGLILAPEAGNADEAGLLGETQLRGLELANLKLVVLSACETAVSNEGLVDPSNLARVFMRAGVPDVVASKWRVDSQASSDLMHDFYTHLLQGQAASNALKEAEHDLRSKPETSHPYYWAAFSIFGG
ncbi:CHAT domain-containing protein [Alloacidobacterium dinghuense]|uniref:CHAT domain-containing protein n=1 Tax=Alloacidobacterium dinghuense TaxID=2763107 RepID=A0A7G8BGR8_9BACT|nr:CHAT domain-containing protein [Alloacidobacterium dinghuense]QNI31738.1 CHAT domain-containing protein [Alloacidobacterium dinghuense]